MKYDTLADFQSDVNRMNADDAEVYLNKFENMINAHEWKCSQKHAQTGYLKERIERNMPIEIAQNKDLKLSFDDVKRGVASVDEFISTLSDEDLETLCHGDLRMDSPLGAKGNAGAFGGITDSLKAKGVPCAITTDGPSGIRLCAKASLLPCGSAIASSWNEELAENCIRSSLSK